MTDSTEALRLGESRFRQLLESMPDALLVADLRGRILTVNAQAETVFGYNRAELVGQPINLLVPEQSQTQFLSRRASCLAASGRHQAWTDTPLLGRRKDGREFPLDILFNAIETPEGPAVLNVVRDLTERKEAEAVRRKLEAQLRQAQKMESIGTLAGGIAHDFNNILGAIVGNAELAKNEIAAGHAVQENLRGILAAAHRATELVKQILAFSRQRKQERKVVKLQPVVKEALKLLRAALPAVIDIHLSIDPDCPSVLADPTQIHQVLMNLCSNAAYAMRERGGRLEITQETLDADADFVSSHTQLREGRYVRIIVSDTGNGMDEATVARIFDPFFTTKPPGEGTGLGLSVVHGIVQNHDAAITVYSQPGQGTAFHLYFPAVETDTTEIAAVPATVPRGQGQRILFVDDETAIIEIAAKTLEQFGYRVTAFNDPAEALAAFRAQPDGFDLTVTDLNMPRMNGMELAQEILRLRPGHPVLLSTGFAMTLNSEDASRLGIRATVAKPFTAQTLTATVHVVLAAAAASAGEGPRPA